MRALKDVGGKEFGWFLFQICFIGLFIASISLTIVVII